MKEQKPRTVADILFPAWVGFGEPGHGQKKQKPPRWLKELREKAIANMLEFEYLHSQRDKITAGIKIYMEEHPDWNRLFQEDPIFKKLLTLTKTTNELYSSLSEEEKKKKFEEHYQNLFWIMTACSSLSEHIDLIVLGCLKGIGSPTLNKRFISDDNMSWEASTTNKLQFLRAAEMITEDEYTDLYNLYRIRNQFAHKTLAQLNTQQVFDFMTDKGINDEKIKDMPKDANKLLNIIFYYKPKLWESLTVYLKRKGIKFDE